MAGRIAPRWLIICLPFGVLWAQTRMGPAGQTFAFDCDGVPRVVALNGTIPAEYRDWDQSLCAPPSQQYAHPGGISAHSLTHKPPKAAAKEFDRGVHAWNKGQNEEAVQHLAASVGLDPGFVEARIDLGIVYAKIGQPEQALDQDEKALALEPDWAPLLSNKAAALVMLHRWEEAEQPARSALQINPELIDAHFMLGLALLMQNKITPETESHLAIAAKKYERARPYLAAAQAALASHS